MLKHVQPEGAVQLGVALAGILWPNCVLFTLPHLAAKDCVKVLFRLPRDFANKIFEAGCGTFRY